MATIGDQLLQPENGWKRFDDTDNNIEYIGTWSTESSGYAGGRKYSNNIGDIIRFNFIGNKIRLFSYTHSSVYASEIEIKIDGVSDNFSETQNASLETTLVYEVTGLSSKEHYVEIILKQNNYIGLDAIDIDENGELKPYRIITPKYIIQNGIHIYSINNGLFKIGEESTSKEMFNKYGNNDLSSLTQILNKNTILMDKVGVLGTGNEFKVQLTSDILNINSMEVE